MTPEPSNAFAVECVFCPTPMKCLNGCAVARSSEWCRMHGEGFVCDHDPSEDYEDVSV